MASTIEKTTSFPDFSTQATDSSLKTTSVDSRYSDPDLLIREYFTSSSAQRAKLRKLIFQKIKLWQSVLAILAWSIRKEVSDAYDGAVDLLAECTDIYFLQSAAQYLESASLLWGASSSNIGNWSRLDDSWEVLIKGIACAYQIPAQERFKLILNIVQISNRRIIKAAIIDALVILSDEMDAQAIKNVISRFASLHEADYYIRNYAEEALQGLV
ncbi:MAG TPA: hypothetical protein DDZ80_01320 [Cyanobacteria bacterium UBA8803]|nr:hypothetical protein [Cyanobacteria bacterium UBA8803]